MTCHDFTDETLVAFADGELDAATTDAVAAAIDTDPALAARVELFLATRERLRHALGPVAQEPVPEALTRMVLSNGGAAKASPSPALRRMPAARMLPIAAALAVFVAGVGGYWIGARTTGSGTGEASFGMLAAAEPALQDLLAGEPDGASTTIPGGKAQIEASYRTRGGICRTFGLDGAQGRLNGVACRAPAGWRVEMVATARDETAGYAPASSSGQALEAFLDSAEAGAPLDAKAVEGLIGTGWK